MIARRSSPRLVGWREWAAFPDLGLAEIKAKLDTGAWTSVIHAWDVQPFEKGGDEWVRFVLHPRQRDRKESVQCEAKVVDRRNITSSSGHRERRYVIETVIAFGTEAWPIELGLSDRDEMGFRLLIGRKAMRGRFIIDPESSFHLGRPNRSKAKPAAGTRKTPAPPMSRGEEE
jgi:hypothetical protein